MSPGSPPLSPRPRSPTNTGYISNASGASYVYPVRSLLSGIQPAPEPEGESSYPLPAKVNAEHADNTRDANLPRRSIDREIREGSVKFPQETPSAASEARSEVSSYFPSFPSQRVSASQIEESPTSSRRRASSLPSPPTDSAPFTSFEETEEAFFDGDIELDGGQGDGANRFLSLVESGIVRLPPSQAGSIRSTSSQLNPSPAPGGNRTSGKSDASSSKALSVASGQPIMTVRFEHKATEGGHHVIVGREGTLAKCEDEPIRVPGAVQGFGVLIAVAEDEETGNLVVRQVSENVSELMGLTPEYLFSLASFTQTLPASQADVLWDNVQYLYELDSDSEGGNGQDSPQVFLLSGWGQPGSAIFDEDGTQPTLDPHRRREWTCWCAAHRPSAPKPSNADGRASTSSASTSAGPSLLILEFELERDNYNPLYPPFVPSDAHVSGESSPGSQSSGAGSVGSGENGSVGSGSTYGPSPHGTGSTGSSSMTAMGGEGNTPKGEELVPSSEIQTTTLSTIDNQWYPSPEDVLESTTNRARPLKALERMRRVNRQAVAHGDDEGHVARVRRGVGPGTGGVSTMDVFALLAQVDDQWGRATDLEGFLKIAVGIVKDLTQFHRVLIYQFDEAWNGQVVAELVDWNQTHDLYKGLHFPASDIPPQARALYAINKVRLLYDRSQMTARLVVRSKADLDPPLDMTHSYLRAMSPIHIKYLQNMGVRASMSISIMAFGQLWGLIACHSYGHQGMRVSFPVRQMLRLMSDSISRNIERLSYAQRLRTRKLISTLPTDQHPTGYIVSNAEDLLSLFDADFGILVIGEGAKILGPNHSGQEVLIVAEYLRLKQFTIVQVSQAVVSDFPDLKMPSGLDVVAGLLYIPLSGGGQDFIAFLRKGQLKEVHWAGNPTKNTVEGSELEPRKSFKTWSETITGRCRAWTDEQLETAGVLALVYGKFIEVWRQKETAVKTNQLTNLLLSNASHEVRTPLNHIINYLELALNGPLDGETRENLRLSHIASKSLLFTINDLLDLTRLESGNETSFNEPFDLHTTIQEAVHLYRMEAERRKLAFTIDMDDSPTIVIGDARKIRTVVGNLTANSVKYTTSGTITVESRVFKEPVGLRDSQQVAVEIVVGDTGCGIPAEKLESIFREFEQVDSGSHRSGEHNGLGLGLAVVARIVEQLGGQLRVDSKVGEGSRFSFLIPFALPGETRPGSTNASSRAVSPGSAGNPSSKGSVHSAIDSLAEALGFDRAASRTTGSLHRSQPSQEQIAIPVPAGPSSPGTFEVQDSKYPVRSVKVDAFELDKDVASPRIADVPFTESPSKNIVLAGRPSRPRRPTSPSSVKLRVLIVEDDPINRIILHKRLVTDGHTVLDTTNGQEAVQKIEADGDFDCILMDIQMPILNGYEASEQIRQFELRERPHGTGRTSFLLNGRIPIFAVSASLLEKERDVLRNHGMDGWICKPIDFKRLKILLKGITEATQRELDVYKPGNWEAGGWLSAPKAAARPRSSPNSPAK